MTINQSLSIPQSNILFPKLKLECQSDYKTREEEFLIDTGFDGNLVISESLAEQLKLKPIGRTKVVIASGKMVETVICEVTINFYERLEFIVRGVVIPQEDCIIGGKLLQKIAKETLTHLNFNYLQDRVEFNKVA
jgi:clan AA aspartic protease